MKPECVISNTIGSCPGWKILLVVVMLNILLAVAAEGEPSLSSSTKNSTNNNSTSASSSSSSTDTPPSQVEMKKSSKQPLSDVFYIVLIVILSLIGITAIAAAVVCWYRHTSLMLAAERVLYRSSDSSVLIRNGQSGTHDYEGRSNGAHQLSGLAKRTDYPAYGVTGPNPLHEEATARPGDGVLNRSAEVYHYNQTKKKMKELSSSATSESGSKGNESPDVAGELDLNDEETSDGEYTVYECSGFAAAMDGPMEITNPLFDDLPPKAKIKTDQAPDDVTSEYRVNPSFHQLEAGRN